MPPGKFTKSVIDFFASPFTKNGNSVEHRLTKVEVNQYVERTERIVSRSYSKIEVKIYEQASNPDLQKIVKFYNDLKGHEREIKDEEEGYIDSRLILTSTNESLNSNGTGGIGYIHKLTHLNKVKDEKNNITLKVIRYGNKIIILTNGSEDYSVTILDDPVFSHRNLKRTDFLQVIWTKVK